MAEFRVTFGLMYAQDLHPLFPDAHPNGWLAVEANDEEAARHAVLDRIGRHWAFIYDPASSHYPSIDGHYPLGELGRIVATGGA